MANGFDFDIQGEDQLMERLRALPAHLQLPITREVTIGAMKVHGEAVRSLQEGPATGRTYKIYTTGPRSLSGIPQNTTFRTHTASAPGEAPMSDTGNLASQTRWRLSEDGFTAWIESMPQYGEWLEHGTTKMEARPWMFPAFEKNRPGIVKRIGKAIISALKRLAASDKASFPGGSQ